jgi:hypothetical protein
VVFRNPTEHTLRFEIRDLVYEVPPGGECDVPPNLAYVVAARGLPLVEGSQGGERVEATVAAPAVVRRLPGVEVGLGKGEADEEDAEDVEADDSPAVAQVEEAASKLRSSGVLPKGKRGR